MASNGSHSNRGVVGRVAKEVQKKLGLLAIFVKQRVVDRLGFA